MRPSLSGLILGLVLLSACGDDSVDTVSGNSTGHLSGRTFLSQSIVEDGAGLELVAGTQISIGFPEPGEISVHAGCNHLFGELESTAGGRLSIRQMGGTEMGCDEALHEQDQWITEFLQADPRWALDDDTLILTGESVEIRLLDRTVADPDRALEGTRWVLDTLITGESASSVPTAAVAEVLFDDGRLVGSGGCNQLMGDYRLDGDMIRLPELGQTKMLCEPPVMEVEQMVIAVLTGDPTYSIVARRLTLMTSDGTGLGLITED